MRDFFSVIIMPFSIFWELMLLAVVFLILKRKTASRVIAFFSFLWLAIISTCFIPDLLVEKLENKYSPLKMPNELTGRKPVFIMVLGGGISNPTKLISLDRLPASFLSRLTEGVRIHGVISNSKIVVSGGRSVSSVDHPDEITRAAISLGVSSASLEEINGAGNMSEE